MLVYDERPGPGEPSSPGLHALVIGTSHYRHMPGGGGPPANVAGLDGIIQLPTSARTAADMAAWLIAQGEAGTLEVPLQTVRLLLSPSAGEPGLPAADPATYDNIRHEANEWRRDARRHRDGTTFFFYSGHGVGGTLDDPILLPADFADPAVPELLDRMISHADLSSGMRPPRSPLETIARRQIYFWDSCRNRLRALEGADWSSLPTIWEGDLVAGVDDRLITKVMATIPEQRAFAGRAGERTLFGQALLECLQGAAAEVDLRGSQLRWLVGTSDITKYLQERMDERNQTLSTRQQFRTGDVMPIPIVAFPEAPRVEVQLSIRPPERAPLIGVTLNYSFFPPVQTVVDPVDPHPHMLNLPMGLYSVQVTGGAAQPQIVRPPRHDVEVDG